VWQSTVDKPGFTMDLNNKFLDLPFRKKKKQKGYQVRVKESFHKVH